MYSTLAPFLIIFTELILAQDNKQNEDLLSSEEDFLNTPKFSLRSSDFAEIATTASFVDKSMFIKTFVEDKEVVVITAPNHFGKSTNVNMLKRFLEIEVDDEGNRKTKVFNFHLPIRDTDNYRLFVENRLKIAENQTFMDQYFGKHPVIHVDMEYDNIHVMSYDVAVEQMKYIVHRSYVDHAYLRKSDRLNSNEKATVKNWCSTSGYSKMLETDLYDSLRSLSRFLYRHYDNRKVYVLIENFDSPAINAILFALTEDIMGGIYRLVSSIILKTLQKNSHTSRGLISGMSYIAGSPALYSLGYVHVCRFLEDHSYTGFHGLTLAEVEQLFSSDRLNLTSDMVHRAETSYGGYKTTCGNLTMYNPWSLTHMLVYKTVRDYWEGPGIPINLVNLLRVPALRNEITLLTEGRERKVKLKKIYAPDDVIRLRDLIHKPELHRELHYADTVLSLLVELGYLSYVPTGQSFTGRHLVRVPNKEMRRQLLTTINKYKNYYSAVDLEDEPGKKHFRYHT
ncbi:uncharacterized protein LOC128991026 [Macrosteles quadrilineatus]|uniref:uncharacterized protein LOC128991026 n=1 Tax=Macrosteles quadrilineatus TaxID=74068 RepID=UPI0023E11AA4|nr:uncharacterized protein LOC128991026 [Macrosteles quadrilineatus]